jgi:hypothetical protein
MATARDIIKDALTEIGVYQPGETISADDYALGLLRFQNQLDAWAADMLTLNVFDRATYTIPASSNTFTIGPTGTLIRQRPVWVQAVNYVVPGSSPPVEVPMGPMDDDSYANLSIKTLASSLPTQYYFNATMPDATMFVWPTPTQNVQLYLYLPTAIGQPATLNSSVTGPPGYQEAFMYQLALRLCNPFGRKIPDALPKLATEAYARMKRPNTEPGLLAVDQALVPSYGGAFNVLTGNMTGPSSR